jgi:hypothetical protein
MASASVMGSGDTWLVVGDSYNDRVQMLTRLGAVVRVLKLKVGDGVTQLGGIWQAWRCVSQPVRCW